MKKMLMGVAAAGLATASVVGTASTAAAGTNGQQIVYRNTPGGVLPYSIRITGTNERGQSVSQCFYTGGNEWTNLTGYWWVGSVSYTAYYNYKCTAAAMYSGSIWVPKERTGDWVQITT
ncbi:hypothetical protein ACIPUC_00695 [Streptomyces sp. LARHCF249]